MNKVLLQTKVASTTFMMIATQKVNNCVNEEFINSKNASHDDNYKL